MVEQPSGTVTLVFTDIEGSTRLLHELAQDAYRDALAAHRRILRDACGRHSGYEVDYEGDAFFYAFQSASEALAAVSETMAGLKDGPVRIRVGVHTGEPGLDPPKYVGLDVHKAARIAACGHGGQVLLSRETRELANAPATDLGEHRLKDFDRPVSIFQLGSERFPPLKTISNTNLPRPASSFVGREREVEEVVSLLRGGARLLTLTGPGGSGKTRLAVEAAAELVPEFKAGVFWVGLAALRDPALVSDTIAQTLGAKDGLADQIGERELLLLLDNLEQVVEAAPELASLVEACPNLRLLSTSRELLRVRGEVEYPVLPLAEPEAVELFCTRSGAEPDETVHGLCRALDNLPLALELAAARASVLSPKQILERLSGRLDLLRGGRDADARQQTLRATVEWSHELLSAKEQRLFARLSVFAGGCTLESAEEVAEADLDRLQPLVDKSLLRHADERFRMLQTVREYAYEQLGVRGEVDELERRHANFFLALAEQAEPEIRGPEQELWLDHLSAENDNLRAALSWSLEQGEIELGVRLGVALGSSNGFWHRRGYVSEGRKWLSELVDRSADVAPLVRARGLWTIAKLADFQGDLRSAKPVYERSLALFRELDDRKGVAQSLSLLGVVATRSDGDYQRARRLGEESVALARELGDEHLLAGALNCLAITLEEGDQLPEAVALSEECLALLRKSGDQLAIAYSLNNIGYAAALRGDHARARATLEEALALLSPSDKGSRANTLGNLGCVELLDGNWLRATSALREPIAIFLELGEQRGLAEHLCVFAGAAAAQGQAIRAGRLWGAVEAALDGAPLSPFEQAIEERYVRAAHAELGEAEWAKESAAGRALTRGQAVDYALEPCDDLDTF